MNENRFDYYYGNESEQFIFKEIKRAYCLLNGRLLHSKYYTRYGITVKEIKRNSIKHRYILLDFSQNCLEDVLY